MTGFEANTDRAFNDSKGAKELRDIMITALQSCGKLVLWYLVERPLLVS
jgi:hypothetical protein